MDNKGKKSDIMTFIFPDMQKHSDNDNVMDKDYSLDEIYIKDLTENEDRSLINTLKINKFFSSVESDLLIQKSTEQIKLLNIMKNAYLDSGILGIQHVLADIRNKILEEIPK